MKTVFTRQRRNLMSNYGQNALIQLIIANAVTFVLAYAMYVIVLVLSPNQQIEINHIAQKVTFHNVISPNIGLQPFQAFLHKPWTLLTYVWAHASFFTLLSNMLWLYCFGSVIQSLVGYREIIPLFIFSYILGGCLYLAATVIWPGLIYTGPALGATPAIMGFAFGAITLTPKFRFYLGDRFSIPLWAMLAIYLVLNLMNYAPNRYDMMILAAGGGLTGFAYIRLLRTGSKPGAWLYQSGSRIQGWFTPDEFNAEKHQKKRLETFRQIQQKTRSREESIDLLLDKINQKGYDSLTAEEKEQLMKASKDN
ncbi:rhomboid family intramembrane serine protease [Taibaiella koreensis]|uniref:rhomboid family intramembrane serine protease n=1 Tax=Taibaiella koreensis TaxID=1268548 RepID=UPI000E59DF99|nr:rhomboid family intramembrane serine protease [Taibaiella koreensis]